MSGELPPPEHLPDEPLGGVERDGGGVAVGVGRRITVGRRVAVVLRPLATRPEVVKRRRVRIDPTVLLGVVRARLDASVLVGDLDRPDRLARIQESEVDRGREQRVREERLPLDHRVLVAPERREPVADEGVERRSGLSAGDRPREAVERVAPPRVEPLADPRVGLAGEVVGIEPRPFGGFPVVGRRLSVQVVVVPLPADRLVAVHQHARLAADVAVPVLLSVAPVGAPVLADDQSRRFPVRFAGPLVPVGGRRPEQLVVQQLQRAAALGDELPEPVARPVARGAHEPEVGVARRAGELLAEEPIEPVAERLGSEIRHVVTPVAEPIAEVAHRREHERQLVGVVRLPVGEAVRLDQQHRVGVGERVEVRVELIAQQPEDGVVAHGGAHGRGRRRSTGTGAATAAGDTRAFLLGLDEEGVWTISSRTGSSV